MDWKRVRHRSENVPLLNAQHADSECASMSAFAFNNPFINR